MGDIEPVKYYLVEFSVWVSAHTMEEAEKEAREALTTDFTIHMTKKRITDLVGCEKNYLKEISEL